MTKQERDSMLYDEFDKFTFKPGESIHSYYLRFVKSINDINMIPVSMTPMQINTKFVNHLQPEWSRFVTAAKQARNLHNVTFDQLVGNARENQPRVIKCYNCNDHVDAYDSESDDEATANAIFMVNLSHVGSLNDDMVAPHYSSDTHFEVPHYDTYHDSNMLNSNIQELGYIENILSNNESYDELKGNNDVLSYTDYMLTIGNDKDNYVPPLVQKNDMMLFVTEQIKSQVEKCNMVNQDAKSLNESLTSKLERYKDKVRVLEYAVKYGHSEQEAYQSRELYSAINDRNREVKDFEKQVFSQQTQMKDFETLKKELSEKTTLSPHEIGSWEQTDIKGAFKADVIPFTENLKETFKLFENGFITEVKDMKDIFEQTENEPKADIGIFIGYSLSKKAYHIYNKRTRQIMETMNIQFDEITKMASEQHDSGPKLQDTTGASSSSTSIDNDAPSEEGIDFEESFAPVARIEAIRIFLAYAAHKNMSKLDEDPNETLVYLLVIEEWSDPLCTSRPVAKIQGKLTDYGFDYNKIPLYSDSQSTIALSCNSVQHSKMKHIIVWYHFIKEQVKNKVVELYFVKTDNQLADILTKALTRERYEFLIKRLGIQSITSEELKHLAESDEE
uniref:Retrotransposon protein, putative, unclassified n=1 Tax=Tanacetum cinerariifolium TaxID=118510 RepID=A0A699HAT7_TANCI|nr:retrotransposon protein, putative, unclassified [Tanacetum cinerariifolium]